MFSFRFKTEWAELRRDVRNLDKEADRAVNRAGRDAARKVVALAQPRKMTLADEFRSYRSSVVSMKPTTSKGMGSVKVFPAAAEFGASMHPVFGQKLSQSLFRRRVWPVHLGDGHLIRPTIEEHSEQIAQVYANEMQLAINRLLER